MDDEPFAGLNMVPFIDIMLVLLTIVLTTSSFIASGRIPVNLPKASMGESADARKTETIEIDAAGVIYLGGEPVGIALLNARLGALDKGTPFLLRADKTVPLQRFIDVVDALKQQGFSKVAVQTEVIRQ